MKKQLREAHKGDFKPYTTSVKKICDEGGRPEYFTQIRNRIFRELEADETLGEFVVFDLSDLEDIRLSSDGVLIFFEILTSYFEENDVRELLKLMLQLNKSAKAEYNLNHSISSMTTQELKSLMAGYRDYIPDKGHEEAKQIVIDMVQTELKKRKRIFA